jgi:hypothetical protein
MSDQATLIAADDARLAAMLGADIDALDALFADELVFVHTRGRREDKAAYLESLRSGRLRYRSLTRTSIDARVVGEVGILTGMLAMEVTAHDAVRSADARFMTVWLWRNGRWVLLAVDMAV